MNGSDQCDTMLWGSVPCPEPARFTHLTACVHEHVRRSQSCAPCLDRIRAHKVACLPCSEGEKPHLCEVAIYDVQELSTVST